MFVIVNGLESGVWARERRRHRVGTHKIQSVEVCVSRYNAARLYV